jgi:hypothetical protein
LIGTFAVADSRSVAVDMGSAFGRFVRWVAVDMGSAFGRFVRSVAVDMGSAALR